MLFKSKKILKFWITLALTFQIAILINVFQPLEANADGNDTYTKLLLHMEDTGLTDSSALPHTMTKAGSTTRASTHAPNMWSYGAYFNADGDYLTTPSSSDWAFGSDKFTIDLWVNISGYNGAAGVSRIMGTYPGGTASWDTSDWTLSYIYNGDIRFYSGDYYGSGIQVVNGGSINLNQWYHIAIVREWVDVNQTKFYINGELRNSGTISRTIEQRYPLNFMRTINYIWEESPIGYLDEVRVSKGIARWTSNFTPPTSPYSLPDTTPPLVPAPTDQGTYITSTSLIFYGTPSDSDSGLSQCYGQIDVNNTDGASLAMGTTAVGTDGDYAFTGSNGNTYYYRYYCTDIAGNSSNWSSWTNGIMLDTAAPTHDSLTVSNQNWKTNNSATYDITLKSTESESGIGGTYGMMALVNYQWDNAANPRGYFAWHPSKYTHNADQITCSGWGFASKNATSYGYQYVTLTACSTSVSGNQRTVILTVRPDTDFGDFNTIHDISFYTTDLAGNSRGWTNFDINFTSDGTSPTVPAPTDQGTYKIDTSLTFYGTPSDSGSGLSQCYAQIDVNNTDGASLAMSTIAIGTDGDHTFTGSNGNTYYYRYYCTDVAGNSSSWSSWTNGIMIDTVAPAFSSKTSFTTDWYNSNQTSTFTFIDNESGIASGNNPTCTISTESATSTCTNTSINVCDNAGNCNTTNQTSNSIKLDKTTPSVSANNASSSWFTSRNVTLSASDATSGISTARYAWDTNFLAATCLSGGTTFTNGAVITVPSGSHRLYLCSRDNAGFTKTWDSGAAQYNVDGVNPTASLTVTGGVMGESGWYTTTPTITLNTSDTVSSIVEYRWAWDDSTPDTWAGGTTASTTIPSNGIHTLYFESKDSAGNVSGVQNQTFKLDTVNPTFATSWQNAGTLGSNGWYTSAPTQRVTITDNTPGSGVAGQWREYGDATPDVWTTNAITDATPGEGIVTDYYQGKDNAGRTTVVGSTTTKLDTVNPTASLSYTNAWTTNASITVTTTEADITSGVASCVLKQATAPLNNGTVGTWSNYTTVQSTCVNYGFTATNGTAYKYQYIVTDNSGRNVTHTSSNVVKVDTTAPVLSTKTSFNTTWYNTNQVSTFTYIDAESGIASGNNPTCTISIEGADVTCTNSSINVCDNAGNCNTTSQTSNSIKLDKTDPTLDSKTSFNTTWYNVNQTSTFTYTDGGSGIASGNNLICTISTEGATSTCTNSSINVCDNAGNCNTTNQTSNSIKLDKTAPALASKTTYTADWYNTNQTSTFSYTDGGSGIASGNNSTCTISTEGATSTCSNSSINVCDNAGNCNTTSQTSNPIKLDKTDPILDSKTTYTTDWYNTNQTSAFIYTDGGSGIASGNNAICTISTEGIASTCTNTSINVCDDAGNCNTTNQTSNTIKLDKTDPVLTEFSAVSTPTNDTTPDYIFNTDEGGAITYGGSCSSLTTNASTGNNTITFSTLAESTYSNCTITITDLADNSSNTLSVSDFTVDTTAMTLSASDADTGSWFNSGSDAIQVTATDGGSGIDKVTYNWWSSANATSTETSNNAFLDIISNGVHTLFLWASDVAGNTSTWSGEYWLDTIDPIAGTISYTDWVQASTDMDITIVYGTDVPSGMSANDSDYFLEYSVAVLDNNTCGTYGAWLDSGLTETSTTTDYTYTGITGNCYKFRYTTKDDAANESIYTSTDETTLMSQPNTPVIDNYNDGISTQDTTPTLQFDLSDNDTNEQIKYQLQIDNNPTFNGPEVDMIEGNYSSSPRNDVTFTSPFLPNSQYYWRVRGIDDNGLESDWATASTGFVVDTILPISTILYPQDRSNLKYVKEVSGRASDSNGILKTRISIYDNETNKYYTGLEFDSDTEVWIDTVNESSVGSVVSEWSYLVDSSKWVDLHTYVIRSRGLDMADNEEHTDSITFLYDTVNGQEGSIYVSNPAVSNNSDYNLYFPTHVGVLTSDYIEIDFPDTFRFSPWLEDSDIVVSDTSDWITSSTDLIDRTNKTITSTITGGSVAINDMLIMNINNLRIHNPSATGSYLVSFRHYDSVNSLIGSGTGEIVLVNPYQQVELNVDIQQSLQLSVDSGAVLLSVDPDVQLGQNWVGTDGAVSEKTEATVKTNAVNGYNLMISLAGNTATGSAILDGTTDTGNTIASSNGDRVSTENNFTFAVNSGSTATGVAFNNSSTQVSGAGTSAPTNSFVDNIYYYLNIDYTTPSDTYQGTVTYTAVGEF